MIGVAYAIGAAIAWGSGWAPIQGMKEKAIVLIVLQTLGAFILVAIASLFFSVTLSLNAIIGGLAAGFIWAFAGWMFLISMQNIGWGRAAAISPPVQILVATAWGILFFGEMTNAGVFNLGLGVVGAVLVAIGAFLSASIKEGTNQNLHLGIIAGLASALLWGSHLVPVQYLGVDVAAVPLPMTFAMFITSLIVLALNEKSLDLGKNKFRGISTGFIWAIGNYLALASISLIGLAKGFSIAQGNVLVAVIWSVFYFKQLKQKDSIQKLLLAGVLIIFGGALLAFAKT